MMDAGQIAELTQDKQASVQAMNALKEQTAALEASFVQEMDALQDQCDRLAVSRA